MKVCIFITHPSQFDVPVFRLGKEFIHVVFTDSSLCNSNFDPELKRNVIWEENILSGFSYEILPNKNIFNCIYNILKKGKFDLVITSGYFRYEYLVSIILSLFLSKKNAIRIDSVGFNNTGIKKLYKFFLIFVINLFVDYFFVVGKLSKLFLIDNGISKNKILFFGYITNSDFFAVESTINNDEKETLLKKYNLPSSNKIVLCVSKHILREAPFDTINAFSLLQKENIHLVIVGDGILNNKLKDLANELKITNISFVGYIEFSLLPKFYAISDLFVHDSRDEPWGVSVQEAIACNIPVIASNKVGAGYDLIIENKNGFVYNVGDYHDLSNKIKLSLMLNQNMISLTNREILNYWNYKKIIIEINNIIK